MIRAALFASGLVAALAACQSSAPPPAEPPAARVAPAPASVTTTVEATARVQAVDMDSRLVVLQNERGEIVTVKAGPEVRNLAQVRPGDRVVVRYTEAIAARMATPASASGSGAVLTRAPAGARPGAGIVEDVTEVVTIVSVDPASNIVQFKPADGVVRAITVRDPSMQAFARQLRPGDRVEVTFVEALAISVVPAR
jgi:hypothetical protein